MTMGKDGLDTSRRLSDVIVDKGIRFLLIFTPVAFGAVHRWTLSVLELVAFLVMSAWITGLRHRDEASLFRHGRLFWILLLLFIFLVVMQLIPLSSGTLRLVSPAADDIYTRFTDTANDQRMISVAPHRTRDGLLLMLSYMAVFVVIAHFYRTQQQIASLVRLVIGVGCFLVLFAIVQKATWNGRLYWIIPLDPALGKNAVNVWGPYINRNHFAGYLGMAVPLALGMLLNAIVDVRIRKTAGMVERLGGYLKSRKAPVIVVYLAASVAMTAALFDTLSRGGVIAYIVSVSIFYLLTRMRKTLKDRMWVFIVFGFLFLAVITITAFDRIEDRFAELAQEEPVRRMNVWSDSFSVIKDFRAMGSGLGTYGSVYPKYQTHSSTTYFEHAHNDYLELAADCGFAGTAIALATLVSFYWMVLKRWKERMNNFVKCVGVGGMSSGAAMLTHSFTDFNFHIPANALLYSVIAGLVWATVFNVDRQVEFT